MAASSRADVLLLVTEPTPFGLHDLELAVGMGRALKKNLAAVINRADLGDERTRNFLDREKIPILAEIPFTQEVAKSYAAAQLPMNHCEPFRRNIVELAEKLMAMIAGAP
jgi:MinD superfamily P-loop ATPase